PRSILADGVCRLARTEIAREQAVGDDRRTLRRYAFIVETERSKPRTMLLPRIGNHVHKVAAIAQRAQLFEREKRSACEIRFHPQHAIEFNRMSHRLVNL